MIKILIVEDHPIVISGLLKLFEESSEISVIGTAQSGKACMDFLRLIQPDVILLDINLPDANGVDLCKSISTSYPNIKVLALTTFMQRDYVNKMMKSGASGYVLKNSPGEEIIEGVVTIMKGKSFFCEEVTRMLKKQEKDNMFLSNRETEILSLIAEGMTTQEISDQLFLSVYTVETHRKNLLTKLNAKNMVSLIKIAVDNKLI
jgi:DNA-binding NarL/FixJ family response regulator